ncbi:hypothetical protein P4N68_02480 [Corynebacterium felinum]|uniref:Secreted protein n=1 Tax=Corynebacterium felinum TaxID=131318 RepID=A0ABU2B7H3_9CORY|nr:hypothetical protein [Corynebacterium felinum]MDF5819950.1 hypothetical protein [Corynebacterium felinum]MDR7354563.1 hypothetical protein [Corynebacterium felinum]WJY93930.1 hypothetical protein CFELI_01410 [Corynebacterium felinum]
MGRLFLLILLIAAAYLVWRAFGPRSWNRNSIESSSRGVIKGPDDDENFLWELEKQQFKQRRAREEAALEEEARIKRAQQKYNPEPEKPADTKDEDSTPEKPQTPGDVDESDNN